jgi:hypothetical protein
MGSQPAEHHIERFVLELLRTGAMLGELVSNLSAALPTNVCPGEEPRSVVIEMLCGTIGTALVSVDPHDVQRATELSELAATRTLEHLRLARDLSRRIHGDDGGVARAYG